MNLQSANFSVSWMAKKLHVPRSGYYAWSYRQENPGPRAKEEERIAKAINPIFAEYKERYGSLRIHQKLRGQGYSVSRKRVERIMKKNGLHAKSRRRIKRTKPTGIQAIAANHLDRQFCPIRPDLVFGLGHHDHRYN